MHFGAQGFSHSCTKATTSRRCGALTPYSYLIFPSNKKSLPVEKGEKNKVWWPQLLSIEHLGPSQTHASMN
jgi:hypothetical protein